MLLKSKWITYTTGSFKSADDKYGNPSPYFRKEFNINGSVKKATLFVSALGVFKVYLNGCAVDGDYLSPGWVDYRKKLPLLSYDVTAMLSDYNAIGVILGDGWAVGHLGSNYAFRRNGYSDRVEFTLTLRVEYADGSVYELISDESWNAHDGAIRRSDIYMGEYIDRAYDVGDFSVFGYDDSTWKNVEVPEFKFSRNLYLEKSVIPPIRVKHTFKPVLVTSDDDGYLYDVGQNIAGVLHCVFRGEKGTEIVIRHGEIFDDGKLYTENLRKAEATDTFILNGDGDEEFRPLFTYHGFRYALIKINGNAEIKEIIAEAMYSDLDKTGEFFCNDKIVNKIYSNALWGQRDNFLNVPTDCPQRDERLGWTGDAHIFCKSAMYNMDCKAFYEKYLADMRDAQLGNGVIPSACPLPPVGSYAYTGRDAAAGWCEAIAEIPYNHYVMYGDKKVLKDNIFALKRLIDYYLAESPDLIRAGDDGYGDWLSLATTDISVVSTLYFARAAYLCASICGIIGDDDEKYYLNLFYDIKKAFTERFIDGDGRILSDTQSAYILAYSFGIISLDDVRSHLVRKFDETKGRLTTGFLAIKYLLPTLCDIGRRDIAYRLITSTEYPGWGYSVVNGATTIWEHWDSYTHEHGIKKGMNSFNHYSFGSCTEWMYEYVLGIRPRDDDAGFGSVVFRPYFDFDGRITSASGYYYSANGRIDVTLHQRSDGCFEYTVIHPDTIKSEFEFPECEVISVEKEDNRHTYILRKANA